MTQYYRQQYFLSRSLPMQNRNRPDFPKGGVIGKKQMEISEDQMSHQNHPKSKKGGIITMPFIIANEAFEKMASNGLVPNMILYLMTNYNMGLAEGTNVLFFWSAATNFTPLVGAFLADSYLGRFLTIALGSISTFLGILLLWLTAMIPQLKPPPCNPSSNGCKSATPAQLTVLLSSFALMSIGAGGVRVGSIAFGADQLDKGDNPKNERVLESFFGLYYAAAALSIVVAFTAIVYIQDHNGWRLGFGVPAIIMFFSVSLFILASPLFVKQKASKSLFAGFAQVVVVTYKNRKLALPPRNSSGLYHHKKDSQLVMPTDALRFLNKACIIRNPGQDITPDGLTSNPWSLCTVDQVEELKALIKVIPIWSTGIMIAVNLNQGSFQLIQALSMDRHITSSFEIPAGSFNMFLIITLTIWVLLYDRVILPLASKLKGKPVRLGVKLRLGIGLFLSCIAMVVSAIVENIRRRKAIHQGFLNKADAVVNMSAMWLAPQHCLNGLAEAFNAIGQIEFYYSEFPKSMKSIATALLGVGMGVASLLASVILNTVDDFTSKEGKESWVSRNMNKGHFDRYYWLLAILSFINLLYFMACSWAYGPCMVQRTKVGDEGDGLKEEEELSKFGIREWDEGEGLKVKEETELSKFRGLPA